MAKKKQNKQQQQQTMSPTKFLKERVRLVPLDKCYIGSGLEDGTEGTILVTRKHTGDKYTLGMYLVDKLCLGVKDASYFLRMEWSEFRDFMEKFEERFAPRECSYEEAHNWIWGAVGFAEDAGIKPCKEFELAQYILAEDDEETELIEFDYGDEEGKHCLLANSRLEASTYLPLMRKHLGEDFTFCLGPGDSMHGPEDWDFERNCPLYDEDFEEYDEEDDWEDDGEPFAYHDETPYHQEHPSYPQELILKNKDLPSLLMFSRLSLKTDEEVDALLQREGIREDLEQFILYYIGQANDDAYNADPSIYDDENLCDHDLTLAVQLLAEVGNEQSLDIILESLRQWDRFYDVFFGDYVPDCYIPALVKLGKDHLDKLMSYAKEPGLYWLAHSMCIEAVGVICMEHPEMREEIIAWYHELMIFAKEKMQDGSIEYFSRGKTGNIVYSVLDIAGSELIEDVKALYEEDLVDPHICGNYVKVAQELLTSQKMLDHGYEMDIHEWVRLYHGMFFKK